MIRRQSFFLALLLVLLAPAINAQRAASTQFSGQAAYTLTKQLLDVAPQRFNGSPGHAKAEEFLKQHFARKPRKETSSPTPSLRRPPPVSRR